jgi:multisubunit Na+/H+ antiporter MnhB subunit
MILAVPEDAISRWFKILVLGIAIGLTMGFLAVGLVVLAVAWVFGLDPDSDFAKGLTLGLSIGLSIAAVAYDTARQQLQRERERHNDWTESLEARLREYEDHGERMAR